MCIASYKPVRKSRCCVARHPNFPVFRAIATQGPDARRDRGPLSGPSVGSAVLGDTEPGELETSGRGLSRARGLPAAVSRGRASEVAVVFCGCPPHAYSRVSPGDETPETASARARGTKHVLREMPSDTGGWPARASARITPAAGPIAAGPQERGVRRNGAVIRGLPEPCPSCSHPLI